MTSFEVYRRLSPRGKRRAAVMEAVSVVIWCAVLFAAGYLACAICAGLQVLAGVS